MCALSLLFLLLFSFVIMFALSLFFIFFFQESLESFHTSAGHHFKLSPASLAQLAERRSYEPKVMVSILLFFCYVAVTTDILFFHRVRAPYEALGMWSTPIFLTILKRNGVDCVVPRCYLFYSVLVEEIFGRV